MTGIILLAAVVAFGLWAVTIYNRLIGGRNGFKNAFAQIDVQLQRRHDLIPNLVETAKGYLKHERETLDAVVTARSAAVTALKAANANPGGPAVMQQLSQAEGALTRALGGLNVTMEAYPDLKASATMMQLSEELTSTENRVAFARQAYNDSVLSYNNAREIFPNNLLSGVFGFTSAEPLTIEAPEMRKAVKVSFT